MQGAGGADASDVIMTVACKEYEVKNMIVLNTDTVKTLFGDRNEWCPGWDYGVPVYVQLSIDGELQEGEHDAMLLCLGESNYAKLQYTAVVSAARGMTLTAWGLRSRGNYPEEEAVGKDFRPGDELSAGVVPASLIMHLSSGAEQSGGGDEDEEGGTGAGLPGVVCALVMDPRPESQRVVPSGEFTSLNMPYTVSTQLLGHHSSWKEWLGIPIRLQVKQDGQPLPATRDVLLKYSRGGVKMYGYPDLPRVMIGGTITAWQTTTHGRYPPEPPIGLKLSNVKGNAVNYWRQLMAAGCVAAKMLRGLMPATLVVHLGSLPEAGDAQQQQPAGAAGAAAAAEAGAGDGAKAGQKRAAEQAEAAAGDEQQGAVAKAARTD